MEFAEREFDSACLVCSWPLTSARSTSSCSLCSNNEPVSTLAHIRGLPVAKNSATSASHYIVQHIPHQR